MPFTKNILMTCVAVLACAGCIPPEKQQLKRQEHTTTQSRAPSPTAIAENLRRLCNAPARVVWVQDCGDGTDTGLESNRLRLMGFDTEDGCGKRAILPTLTNYARPLFTPRGDRVVFSDRHAREFKIVNWDGTGLTTLGKGLALATWLDNTGSEWVYFGPEVNFERLVSRVYRCRIDRPGQLELVWDRTPVGLNNFILSADGGRAGGVFPWPECGVADLKGGTLQIFGKGCYPALAPDLSGYFWIFDGAHRHLLFFETLGAMGGRWKVPINTAPGIDGYEVYYPRWANLARFLVMSGPFKVGTGDNRIRGGGTAVEIFAGRFSADFRSIEAWTQVTWNQSADFYPDLWIAPSSPYKNKTIPASATTDTSAIALPPWPSDQSGLLFCWDNRTAPNEVAVSGGRRIICRLEPHGRARYGRHFEMHIQRGWFSAEQESVANIAAGIRQTKAFTVEMVLTPAANSTTTTSVILALTSGENNDGFLLGMHKGKLACSLRRTVDSSQNIFILEDLPAGLSAHVIVSCYAQKLSAWINGRQAVEITLDETPQLDYTGSALSFGALPDGKLAWSGAIEGVAIYNRLLKDAEIAKNFQARQMRLRHSHTVLPHAVVEACLQKPANIPAPYEIAPYRRALVLNQYQMTKQIAGDLAPPAEFLGAEWAIMDGLPLPEAEKTAGQIYRLRIEEYDRHPELEGERLIMENILWDLPIYYILDE